jgi:hypothetical protein
MRELATPEPVPADMIGFWFLAAAPGNKLACFFDPSNPAARVKLYGGIAVGLLASAGILALLTPEIKKLRGKVH